MIGIQAGGNSEPVLRIDSHGRMYVTVPYVPFSLLWRSLDGGTTFKWPPAAAPHTGRLPICSRDTGGDAEIATDSADRLYFSDRFHDFASPYNTAARSDDQGATFSSTCDVTSGAATDRPWYAVDGDPTRDGTLYLELTLVGAERTCAPGEERDRLAVARSPVPGGGAQTGVSFSTLQPVNTGCGVEFVSGGLLLSPRTHHLLALYSSAVPDGDSLRLVRCEAANVSEARPAGVSCTDRDVVSARRVSYGRGAGLAIDNAGNLFVVWSEFPFTDGKATGDTRLLWSSSTDEGVTWRRPTEIPTPGLRNNVFPWAAAGDAGRVDVAWYGTGAVDTDPNAGCGGAADAFGDWNVYMAQTLNGLDATPTFSAATSVGEHFVHRGGISGAPGGKFCGDFVLGDFLQLRIGPAGEANIVYADSNNSGGRTIAHPMLVRQDGGAGVLAGQDVPTAKRATNAVDDPAGDATYDARGRVSPSQPNLDVLHSSISQPNARTYRIRLKVADLRSLAPDRRTGNPDGDLVWLVQWLVPSKTLPLGGADMFAYMESIRDGRPRFWAGQTQSTADGSGAGGFIYPGTRRVRGRYTPTRPGTITIDVPAAAVRVPQPISRALYQVTTSTMTLSARAVTGGLFNVIDVAPSYDFVP